MTFYDITCVPVPYMGKGPSAAADMFKVVQIKFQFLTPRIVKKST